MSSKPAQSRHLASRSSGTRGAFGAAARFLDLKTMLNGPVLSKMQSEALDAARHPDVSRHWLWLAERAARKRYTHSGSSRRWHHLNPRPPPPDDPPRLPPPPKLLRLPPLLR